VRGGGTKQSHHHLPGLQKSKRKGSYLYNYLHIYIEREGVPTHHVGVESAWSDERVVEALWEICGCDDDDSRVLLESVHLYQQLVECHLHRLLLLGVAVRSDGVDLVDENDAGSALLGLSKWRGRVIYIYIYIYISGVNP